MAKVRYIKLFAAAKPKIEATFDVLKVRVLTHNQLHQLYIQHGKEWGLGGMTFSWFLYHLISEDVLVKADLQFPGRAYPRYTRGTVDFSEVIQSISPKGYFSHFSAIHFNRLTQQLPKTYYFNIEQRTRPGGGQLTQSGIDRAFANKPRQSNAIAETKDYRIVLLNGANTGALGVSASSGGPSIRITNVERTLIDAAVRPYYCGGPLEVLNAFKEARRHEIKAHLIPDYLKQIGYTYPYHQVIGFYMERAGYAESETEALGNLPREFNFYLDYGMKVPVFNATWKLFIPKGF
jgi:hypothetical protein